MIVLLWSSLLLFSSLLIQILVWKICIPRRQAKTLLVIFSGNFIIVSVFIFIFPKVLTLLDIPVPQSIATYLHIALFYWAFTMAYLITYSAVEVDSPSLIMTLAIQKAGEEGLPIESFEANMSNELLLIPRVRDLVHDQIAVLKNGTYHLTPKGIVLAKIFNYYRNLLNIKDKGG